MVLSKSVRRIVASFAAIAVLLCQSIALAHACAGSAVEPAAAVAHPPCHDAGENDAQDPAYDAYQPPCLSQIASPSSSALDAPVVPGLPLIVVRADWFGIYSAPSPAIELRLARNASPPLTILHCCLRN